MTRDEAKEYLHTLEPDFLAKAKIMGREGKKTQTYVCPKCGNGSRDSKTGMRLDTEHQRNGKRWVCFSCEVSEDIIGLWKIHKGITDDREAFESLYRYYGIKIDSPSDPKVQGYGWDDVISNDEAQPQEPQPQPEPEPEKITSFKALYAEAAKHIGETDYHRGISEAVLKRFWIGYVPNWRHPDHPNAPASPRMIIPISEWSYLARDARSDDQIPENAKDYTKQKVKGRDSVSWIFNAKGLEKAQKPIFVVEGEIDAMSVIEAGGEAVAIGSTAYIRMFCLALDKFRPSQPLIVSLDADAAGQSAAEKLMEELKARNITAISYNVSEGYKDANELLLRSKEDLIKNVAEGEALARKAAESAKEEEIQSLEADKQEYMKTSALSHLQNFKNGIQQSADTPCIPTGFEQLDGALDGGFYEGLYTVGAISSLGKTTLVLQIADNIAKAGRDVLIFSMEMSEHELMGKSISRLTFLDVQENGGRLEDAKTYRGITVGSRYANYSKTEMELIQRAMGKYEEYAGNIYVTEGVGDVGVTQIGEIIRKHIRVTGNKPVVFIDYLQILAPYEVRNSDKQNTDKAVLELKRISRDLKIPIIDISALNRQSYDGEITLSAFKESGAIEYGSDVLIGLQFKGCGGANFDVKAAKRANPRSIELVILKNRNGETGDVIGYDYYPLYNYFEEA